jgi:hypothetical protein
MKLATASVTYITDIEHKIVRILGTLQVDARLFVHLVIDPSRPAAHTLHTFDATSERAEFKGEFLGTEVKQDSRQYHFLQLGQDNPTKDTK